jgi:hypothetical protein
MHSAPIHPIDIPIQSPTDAEMALPSMKHWIGSWKLLDHADRDQAVDRVLEILTCRLSQAWEEFTEANPVFPEVRFRFFSPRGMERLLVSHYCPDDSEISADWDLPEFSDQVLFGGKRNAGLVEKALRHRFGRIPMDWPSLCPSDGNDAVLHTLMTPAHRMRREALMLDQSTATCETQRHAPRL